MEDRRAAKLIYWDPEGKKIIVPDSEALENAKLLSDYFSHNNVRLAWFLIHHITLKRSQSGVAWFDSSALINSRRYV